jgi:hypothetical protein
VHEPATALTFKEDSRWKVHFLQDPNTTILDSLVGGSMAKTRDPLFKEWIESWAEETGLGVPCGEAQADGVPCFELDRDCAECEEAYQAWLEYRRKRGLAEDAPA